MSTKPPQDPLGGVSYRSGGDSDPIRPPHLKPSLKALTMRKIETQMNAAITNNVNWQSANTAVTFDAESGESKVFLHGNHIATVGENFVQIFDGGWQSNTTKSRLNAILSVHGIEGEGVFQKNFDWHFRMSDGSVIPFFSGMRLN